MKILEIRMAITGILLLLTVISGVIVSALGRPLNAVVFAIHKLLALSSVVFAVIVVYALQKDVKIGAPVIILIGITGLLFLSLFISGAFLSFEKPAKLVWLTIHRVAPLLTAVSAVLSVYLQLWAKM